MEYDLITKIRRSAKTPPLYKPINQAHQPVVMRCPLVCFLMGLSINTQKGCYMMKFKLSWQEKNGSSNHSIVEAQKMSDAVAYIEKDERCDYVYLAVEVNEE